MRAVAFLPESEAMEAGVSELKVTIAYVHHGTGVGGAPLSLANIISSLDKKRFRAVVFCLQSAACDLFRNAGAQVIIVPHIPTFRHTTAGSTSPVSPKFWLARVRNCLAQDTWRRHFAAVNPAIIHFNSITLTPLLSTAKQSTTNVVVSIRETAVPGTFGFRRRYTKYMLNKYARAIHFISEFDKQLHGLKTPICKVIRNWVDFKLFVRTADGTNVRTSLGIGAGQTVVLTLGGVTRIKGTEVFLKAASLLKHRKDITFLVVGLDLDKIANTSPLKRAVKKLLGYGHGAVLHKIFSNSELTQNTICCKHRSDIPDIIAASDMVVFSAIRPHQARPSFEAGAMAKPIIASHFDCLKESITDHVNGIFFPPHDSQALAKAISELADSKSLTTSMGSKNWKHAVAMHNKDINCSQVIELYEQCLRTADEREKTDNAQEATAS
ncbi:glycosyltransferase family 4 protein [Adhaeretor mobilis]|uniref:Putative glycosyl transferase n=1 Tax=Adhaeretor mobilis TaxID=1930276 RepID=A0A517MPZ3_9BACT|nr:glycosyltransferase family 4 protein [Adhaeretor mobilis]QDS96955.1 putative glycosyl transferase [Adhaeretor mobilis]